jgi:DNA helicase IV
VRVEDDGYAHVLVDEAQDLTPMQWRMVGRRGRTATWTVVGDPAQSSWPVPSESASARAEALRDKEIHSFHLSKNYRNSAEIYDYAAAYADRVVQAYDDVAPGFKASVIAPIPLDAAHNAARIPNVIFPPLLAADTSYIVVSTTLKADPGRILLR